VSRAYRVAPFKGPFLPLVHLIPHLILLLIQFLGGLEVAVVVLGDPEQRRVLGEYLLVVLQLIEVFLLLIQLINDVDAVSHVVHLSFSKKKVSIAVTLKNVTIPWHRLFR
jgi:hypothetical protein